MKCEQARDNLWPLAEDSCICVWHALAFFTVPPITRRVVSGNAASPAWVLGRETPSPVGAQLAW